MIIGAVGDDSRGGAFSALKSIYSPSSNRIRLKVEATKHNGIKQQPMVLDLAIVDHELSRDSSNHGVTLTINYRGYMQSMMQMPFANSLMTKDIYNNRKLRHNNIKTLLTAECSQETLREILRIERSTAELEMVGAFSNLTATLYAKKSIKGYKFKPEAGPLIDIVNQLARSGKDKVVEITGQLKSSKTTKAESDAALAAVAADGVEDVSGGSWTVNAEARSQTGTQAWYDSGAGAGPRKWGNFVFFGDLIHAISDVLYTDNSRTPIPEIKENLTFVLFPIQIPDPTSVKGFIELNPAVIPIDLYFLAEWWHEVIIKKNLKNYPIASLIRDLTERLINNLLYEVCISNLLPDESPPMLRVNYYSSNEDLILKAKRNTENALFYDYTKTPKPFFPQSYDTKATRPTDLKNHHYIVLYSMTPPFRRELAVAAGATKLKDSVFVPTLHHGIYSKDAESHIDSAELKKTNSPGLREARYFNNNFGSLALMNNVYDLSFKIVSNNPSTYLYPGMLINFILTDFGTTLSDGTGVKINTTNYTGTDNDPHKSTSIAHLLGLGGYFLIKSVSYVINGSKPASSDFEFNCEAKFVGTDGDQLVQKDEKTVREIIEGETDDKCVIAHDNAVKQNQAAVATANTNASADDQVTSDFTEINSTTPTAATAATAAGTTGATPVATNPGVMLSGVVVPPLAPGVAVVTQFPLMPYTISKSLNGAGVNPKNDVIEVNFKGADGTRLGAKWTIDPNSSDIVFDSYIAGGITGAKDLDVPGVPVEE